MITLRPITEDNFQEVLNLDLRSENQTFVDSVAYSLAEAWLHYAEFDFVAGEVESPSLGDVMDAGHDLADHISGKTCSRLVTHRLLLREIRICW